MKRWLLVSFSFAAGTLVASVAWRWQLSNLRLEYAAAAATSLHGRAGAGEQVLGFLDDPQPDKAIRLALMASNMVSGFLVGVDMCEEKWPYLHIRNRYSSEYDRFDKFLRERQTRFAHPTNGEQAGRDEPSPRSSDQHE